MQRGAKYTILVMMFTVFIALIPVLATADGSRLYVNISDAYYSDQDNDGFQDDIVTKFDVRLLIEDEYDNGTTYLVTLVTELTMPSGLSFRFIFDVYTQKGFEITQIWNNGAQEPGWYEFSVSASVYASNIEPNNDIIIFDPPGYPGDPPQVDVLLEQYEV